LKLVPILALAFYVAFMPHINYPYPVHIDEWVHMAYAKALIKAGSMTFVDPFFGEATLGMNDAKEAGFQLFWGIFNQISGLSWTTIFRYFPGIIFVITVLSVYILARREGFGWEAALLTCLIPTTVGILGPAFLVPVAMGLLFIPLTLFVAFNFRNVWSYLSVCAFTSFLLIIHPPSAICLVIILAPYVLINLVGNFKHSLGLILALIFPLLVPFAWIFSLVLVTARHLFAQQPLEWYVDLPRIITTYGYFPISLCLLGVLVVWIKGGRKGYGLILGLLAVLLMLVVFNTFHYGVPIVYYRGLTFMMLMMSIVAGAGLAWVKNLRVPENLGSLLKVPSLIGQNIGAVLCLTLIVITLIISIPSRQIQPYYNMIDQEDYEAFVWIRDNVSQNYAKAILDPWKATAFAAITGKYVFTRIHGYPKPSDEEAYSFLQNGCSDTSYLRNNRISLVYTQESCTNTDLVEVRKNVYLLEEATK
jgi:hypothetical protein